ncbi:MAG TPA: glycosyltransferase family 2 protein, partial [Blastocatellia bacterium]|nr:glycosyltransferase family 2 protein [Blastocatellia bacterium]
AILLMLDQITPIILTYNEAPNIGRALEQLQWARDIVVVDSFSDDQTLDIVARTRQARVFQREFDRHETQWNFALKETGITSEWVLALDADYALTPELVNELSTLKPEAATAAYRARFVYCVSGRALRGSAYPPVTVLYRRQGASYRQDGHTQRVLVQGNVEGLRAPILHDDRKSFGHWLRSQRRYMKLETRKLLEADWRELDWADRVRKMIVPAPLVMFAYCLFVRGAILDGRAGLYYAFQRFLSEVLLSLYLIDHALLRRGQPTIDPADEEHGRAALAAASEKEGEPVAHTRH